MITYELILGRLSHGSIHLAMMPKNMQPLLAQAINPDPTKRYEDIVDFVKALSDYYKSDMVKADMRGTDYMGELNEDIKSAQGLLLPSQVPSWSKNEIGLVSNSNMALSSVYYDFFQQREGVYDIVMAQSDRTGVEGVLQIAQLRGMIHALFHGSKSASELICQLNERLIDMTESVQFSLAFLSLYPAEGRLAYISMNSNALGYIPSGSNSFKQLAAQNPALGVKRDLIPLEVGNNWNVGDKILLHSFQSGKKEYNEEVFLSAAKEHAILPPKNQVDAISRRLLSMKSQSQTELACSLISCERTS